MSNNSSKHRLKLILIGALALLLVSVFLVCGYVYYTLNAIKTVKISKNNRDLGIKVTTVSAVKRDTGKITNIALFGIDTGREKHEAKHSDSIIILSIDKIHNKIRLSSLMRDMYVNIAGHGMNKINAAYAYGGPQLAIKTINENFNLDIKDYVTANFAGLSDIIDSAGGIEIDVKAKEIPQINKYMKEVAKIRGENPTPIIKSGIQRLNGNQAVAYARIRKVGNGDFERTERQKTVLLALFKRIKSKGIASFPFIGNKFLSCLETSMSKTDILKTGTDILGFGISNIDWYRFPIDGYLKAERINKIYCLTSDLKTTAKQINSFIYDDIKTPPYKKRLLLGISNKKERSKK